MRYITLITATSLCLVAACGKGEHTPGESSPPAGASAATAEAAGPALTQEKAQSIVDTLELGEGWTKGMKNASADGFMVTFQGPENAHEVKQKVTITAMPCSPVVCTKLEASAWKANADQLKTKLSKELAESEGLVFDIADATVDGKAAVAVYTAAYVEKATEDGGTSRSSANTYDLYWHNGKVVVVVSASPGYSGAKSLEEVKTTMTREELEKAATAAMSATIKKLEG